MAKKIKDLRPAGVTQEMIDRRMASVTGGQKTKKGKSWGLSLLESAGLQPPTLGGSSPAQTPPAEAATTQETPALIEEQITPEQALEGDLIAQAQAEEARFGESVSPTSIEEIFAERIAEEARVKERAAESEARTLQAFNIAQTQEARRTQAGVESMQVAAAGAGREAPTSASMFSAQAQLKNVLNEQAQLRQIERDNLMSELDNLNVEREQAIRSGRADLVSAVEAQIANKKLEIQQADTQYINALTQQAQEERATRSEAQNSLNNFVGFVGQGVEFSDNAIANYAETLGLPYNTVKSVYDSAQNIVKNNQLTTAEKEIGVQSAFEALQDQIAGIETAQAKNLDLYLTMKNSGQFSQDELIEAARALGVDSTDDPLVQTAVRIQDANARIQEIEAGGEPPKGSAQWYERESLKLQVQQAQQELSFSQSVGSFTNEVPSVGANTGSSLGKGTITAYGSSLWSPGLDFVLDGGESASVNLPFAFEVIDVAGEDCGPRSEGCNSGFGKQVKVRNIADGKEMWISHLSSLSNIQVGQTYTPGTSIGFQGNSGSTIGETGIHLDITMPDGEGGYYSAQQVASYLGVGQTAVSDKDIQIALSQIPTQLKNSEKELERLTSIAGDIFLQNPGISPLEVSAQLLGFDIENEADRVLAANLRTFGSNSDADLAGLSVAINGGNYARAIATVENALLQDVDSGLGNQQLASNTIIKANRALELLAEVPEGYIGQFDSRKNQFATNIPIFADSEDRQKAKELAAILTDMFSDVRKEYLGSAVTDSEQAFLNPLLADLRDQPGTIETKLDALKNKVTTGANTARESVGLPSLNENQFVDAKAKEDFYRTDFAFENELDDYEEMFNQAQAVAEDQSLQQSVLEYLNQ